ncbi:hypothetical protein [Adhaeretor mobilis]|uniref:Uncharacterized protein n=1 Tax=Adhaeretor mobilis TaxID=1930276 RepID=A0A517MXE0_9BACT|nr:hypothetical protein [Adhaeretor mobilis]QDS99529.1 hypothetical protein HG15A2_28530 [Adhaeretor mobilis]
MNLRKYLLIATLAACPLASAETASAQCGGGYCGGLGLGAYADVGRLYNLLDREVPHFAAFPPVYYSNPVPRTYGHSPFAYLPSHVTPAYAAPAPLAIDNPFVKNSLTSTESQSKEEPSPDQTTSVKAQTPPLAIVNPFFKESAGPMLQVSLLQ